MTEVSHDDQRRAPAPSSKPSTWRQRALNSARSLPALYLLFAAGCTLWIGTHLFSSMRWQVFLSEARNGSMGSGIDWSAPLDDVFIHFDFARSIARGYPFEWSEGNGYSSGATSMPYPLVLALGYRLGYQGLELVLWSGITGCMAVMAWLTWSTSLLRELPRWTWFILPPVLLSAGSLNWSAFSGMEVAFFMACWALCLPCWFRLVEAPSVKRGLQLGLACALMVAARPEAVVVVAILSLSATLFTWRRLNFTQRGLTLLTTASPGAVYIVGGAITNRALTGEWSAAGALVKLIVNHPSKEPHVMLEAWWSNVAYQFRELTDHHLMGDGLVVDDLRYPIGWVGWALAALSLVYPKTRTPATLLWLSALLWIGMVALNVEVRSHNDRYSMPALAWLLTCIALGLAALASGFVDAVRQLARQRRPQLRAIALLVLGCMGGVGGALFFIGQEQRFAAQTWLFGRASRNIYEQHIRAGRLIKNSRATRVLLGDAGAIPYVSDIPAIDIIGLGGYHDYPFARAIRQGIGASLELIQRLPKEDRPDLMALYPSWWADLPPWFGERLQTISVRGNTICGAVNKVIYQPQWQPLDNSTTPFHHRRQLQIRTELDVADLMSERAGGFSMSGTIGIVRMKMLPHPNNSLVDAWDAGREFASDSQIDFTLHDLERHRDTTLVLRLAPATSAIVTLTVGDFQKAIELSPQDAWAETSVEVPAHAIVGSTPVTLHMTDGKVVLYHVWGLQR